MRVLPALGAAALVLVLALAAGCNGDDSDSGDDANEPPVAESATLAGLRSAKGCPLQVDESKLPASLQLNEQGYVYSDVSVDDEGGMVRVGCEFRVTGAGPQSEVSVSISALPAGSAKDLFSIDSFANLTYNETGVDMAQLQPTVDGLAVDEVAALQGSGEFLAVRPVEVDGASSALLLVHGSDGLSEDALTAAASATSW